ncbi:hypothetical protein ACIPY3_22780 [Paenarthrobacter sp. NPDC089714]|uniref:hypothetical protein n=1 Tax=unclassified Paenarthrobacter TaxID=2634190 RepID=UPI0037CBDB7C
MLCLADEHVEVLVTDPWRHDEMLDNAEAVLRQKPQRFAGILVTRHQPGRYTLALSDSVPFGETRELILA